MAYTETKLTNLGHLKDLAIKSQAEIAAVEAKIPTNVSQLTNDAQYQTSSQVTTAIQQAIAASGHASFQKVDAVPEAESAQTNILYLVMNDETSHYDIYAKVDNEMVLVKALFIAAAAGDTRAFDRIQDVLGRSVAREELALKKQEAKRKAASGTDTENRIGSYLDALAEVLKDGD